LTYEYVGNLHAHSSFSDGHGLHDVIALAAIRAGLDLVVITDHNVLVEGLDGYRYLGDRRVLLLTGEEIHDQNRDPQKNHLLVYEVGQELAPLGPRPQRLLDTVARAQGLSFLAHPDDPAAPKFRQADLSWVSWELRGYTGIELWNFMTEFKSRLTSVPSALWHAYFPSRIARSPMGATLARWDEMLREGRQVVAIGGADAHGSPLRFGPLRRVVFPYEFLFRAVNTHILTPEPLAGNVELDRHRLFQSLRKGHVFVGYDLPHRTNGFRFTGLGDRGTVEMGDTVQGRFGVTLQVKLPIRAHLRLIHNGHLLRSWDHVEAAVHTVSEPGAYRVEAAIDFLGRKRGWIYSNPIYVTH
jgi:hypothetical protein